MAIHDETFGVSSLRLITCLDDEGNEINIGAGAVDGRVTLIGPPGGTAVLTEAQAAEYREIVTAALIAATSAH